MTKEISNKRKEYERTFHNRLAPRKFPIYDNQLLGPIEKQADLYLGDLEQKTLLFYGCGTNWKRANEFYHSGCSVTMVDIANVSIEFIRKRIDEKNQGDRMFPLQMDCEELSFKPEIFDLVYGKAILHHLDLEKSLREIFRVLKPGGKAVFIEPLGNNPILNFYRKLTPHLRTPYEHPLGKEDFIIINQIFNNSISYKEFTLVTFLGIGLNYLRFKIGLNRSSLEKYQKLDEFLLKKFPSLGWYYWNIVLCMKKPVV